MTEDGDVLTSCATVIVGAVLGLGFIGAAVWVAAKVWILATG